MDKVISVENLGKRYTLHHQSERQPYLALRDVLAEGARTVGRRLLGQRDKESLQEEFWALRDVSFEVNQGDRMGIIGRNGAGKSTLLKILSRITEPTTGRVRIKGRVASLLEVGTGFHPELTGRENIYLNGAILGMSRFEIKQKFDEIVDFAEIGKFLDTPVKRYSSGMYVRLAFAVAAHLEPEILIVDEVLAVGDAQFQKKCLGKMEDVSREGRTIMFVSHNIPALCTLCNRSVLIEKGKVVFSGAVDATVDRYLSHEKALVASSKCKDGNRFLEICTVNVAGVSKEMFTESDRLTLRVKLFIDNNVNVQSGITVFNSMNVPLISSCLSDDFKELQLGTSEYSLQIPVEFLHSGSYRVEGAIWDQHKVYDKSESLCNFTIVRSDSSLERKGTGSRGYLRFPYQWTCECTK